VIIAALIGYRLSLEVLSSVVRVVTQPIEKGESFTVDRDGNLCTKLNITTGFPADNQPDMRLAGADDAMRNASAVCMMENSLLADQFTDLQQLLVDMKSGG
jgi:hypothetical protein